MSERLSKEELSAIRNSTTRTFIEKLLLSHIDALQEENDDLQDEIEEYKTRVKVYANRLKIAEKKGCGIQ